MKTYGHMKATEFSAKQIGVIYRNAKMGNIKLEKWVANDLYELAEYYGIDDNGSVEKDERNILLILEAIFSNDFERAQNEIDFYTEHKFESLSQKYRNNANRNLVA